MKKIVRRVPAHTVRSFQCEVCGTKYRSAKQAIECESRTKEKKAFRVGDRVLAIEARFCNKNSSFSYMAIGKIVKIEGPVLPDQEYERKWLGGDSKRLNSHVYKYWLSFKCPHCNEKRKHPYYGPELRSKKF